MAYKIYVTDSLFYNAQNRCLTERFYDIINKKIDTRSADEIVADVIAGAGLRFKEE